jgi:ABC-type transporter Mla maintaining outer membrane lipid asymmetry ATPase subunit MlaF
MSTRASEAREGDVAISMRGIRVSAPGGAEILRGIDLDVYAGAINTIVGPSGSGKTALLKMMNGLVELDGRGSRGGLSSRGGTCSRPTRTGFAGR